MVCCSKVGHTHLHVQSFCRSSCWSPGLLFVRIGAGSLGGQELGGEVQSRNISGATTDDRAVTVLGANVGIFDLAMRPDATAHLRTNSPPPARHNHAHLLICAACTFLEPAAIDEPVHARNITPRPAASFRAVSASVPPLPTPPTPSPWLPTDSRCLSLCWRRTIPWRPRRIAHRKSRHISSWSSSRSRYVRVCRRSGI